MNYMGSKQRIAKYIVPIIQSYIDDNNIQYYIEPMAGSLSIIDKIRCDYKIAYDLNRYLIYLFIYIRSGGKLPDVITKETYDVARKAWQNNNKDGLFKDWELGCIGWLCSYSGRGFDGGYSYEGDERRKDGTIKHRYYYQERKRNLLKQFEQPLCQDIMFAFGDYRELDIENAELQYVVYVDPPYKGTKTYANAEHFDYDEFWDIMRLWSKKHIVLISELEAPDDFECIWEKSVSRSIKATDKSRATEKLFKLKE